MNGRFITFEGGEGTGKTSVIKLVKEYLEKLGYEVVLTREPGGTDISEQIRNVILDVKNTAMAKETEALLYAASRVQHLSEKVIPAINAGKIVLCDRYLDSSLVYQGYTRGLGFDEVMTINLFATKNLPDLTIFMDVEPEIALKRISSRDGNNRLDLEKMEFHKKVYEGYKKLAMMYPERIKSIDGHNSIEQIYQDVLKLIDDIIK